MVAGNFIGTNAAGNGPLGNLQQGILITTHAANNTVGGVTATPGTGAGNVISANQFSGVVTLGTSNNLIAGNIVGLNAGGTAILGNFVDGAGFVVGTGNTLGGTVSCARGTSSRAIPASAIKPSAPAIKPASRSSVNRIR